jgi:hypothetical protein
MLGVVEVELEDDSVRRLELRTPFVAQERALPSARAVAHQHGVTGPLEEGTVELLALPGRHVEQNHPGEGTVHGASY